MDILTEEMATLIVNETAKRTKTNINIMNFNGVIIASFDKRRIGTLHEGAIEVLKQEKTVVIVYILKVRRQVLTYLLFFKII